MAITGNYYGRTSDGKEVYSYTLENAAGMRAVMRRQDKFLLLS